MFGVVWVAGLFVIVRGAPWGVMMLDDDELIAGLRRSLRRHWRVRCGLGLVIAMLVGGIALSPLPSTRSFGTGSPADIALFLATILAWTEWDNHWVAARLAEIDDGDGSVD